MLLKKIPCMAFAIIFFVFSYAFAAERGWQGVVDEIEVVLNKGADVYADGKTEAAKAKVSDAYFAAFEEKGMETAVRLHISSKRAYELESMFGGIRKAINTNASASDVKERIDLLVKALREDIKKLPEKDGNKKDKKESPYAIFFNSFIIILREGFEAILVISALTAYLAKTHHKDKIKTVYKGAGIAIIVSILTAIIFNTAVKISGAGREAMEGITMLFAAVVLFYVSYWLITKIEVARWQHFIKSKVKTSLSRGNIFTLGFASFLAVYREGAETILFYQALYSSSDGNSGTIIIGFAAGSLLLVGLFILIKYGSVKIPVGQFFAVTSTLLYYLAFTFAGKGILELQEALWISSTSIEWLPTISFLGIYPTWEGIMLQAILVLALLIAIVYSFILRPFREKAMAAKDISYIESDIKILHDILDDVSQHAMICHGLASGIAGQETDEIRKHLVDIDSKVYEVMGHLTKLEKGLEDVFSEIEKEIIKQN